MINDRIKAHRSAPDVYDPPTFDQMADRIAELEDKLARADFRRRLCRGKYLACRIEELEAKLAKAVELALEECPYVDGTGAYLDWWFERRATLAKLKGDKKP